MKFIPTHIVVKPQTGLFTFLIGQKLVRIGENLYKDKHGNARHLDAEFVEELK